MMKLDEEVMQAIESKEEIIPTDVSVKEIKMTGCWRINMNVYQHSTACGIGNGGKYNFSCGGINSAQFG